MSNLAIRTYHLEQNAADRQPTAGRSLTGGLPAIWRTLAAWRERRQTRKLLYGMPPYLLRDIGVDPAEIYDQYHGVIGELPGDRFRGLPAGRWRPRG